MCGVKPPLLVDPAWPDVAMDGISALLCEVRCALPETGQQPIPLAFRLHGGAVAVRRFGDHLFTQPITANLLALDLVHHICRPVRLPKRWRASIDDPEVLREHGEPCSFPLDLARVFLASRRIDALPPLTKTFDLWTAEAALPPGWTIFRDRIVEAPADPPVRLVGDPQPAGVSVPLGDGASVAAELPTPPRGFPALGLPALGLPAQAAGLPMSTLSLPTLAADTKAERTEEAR